MTYPSVVYIGQASENMKGQTAHLSYSTDVNFKTRSIFLSVATFTLVKVYDTEPEGLMQY
jgi:hypothetical protein